MNPQTNTPLQKQINQMQWTLEGDTKKPLQFECVLVTIPGFKKACIGALWGREWFLINQLDQSFDKSKSIKVTAWRYLPEPYSND